MIYIGYRISEYYRKRCLLLENTVLFLNRLKIDFEYTMMPLCDVLKSYSAEYMNVAFIKKCYEYSETGYDFPEAFSKSVEEEKMFSSDEKNKLISFGNLLGTSSVDTQIMFIEYYIKLFEKKHEEVCHVRENSSKSAFLVCVFIGLGIYIISV